MMHAAGLHPARCSCFGFASAAMRWAFSLANCAANVAAFRSALIRRAFLVELLHQSDDARIRLRHGLPLDDGWRAVGRRWRRLRGERHSPPDCLDRRAADPSSALQQGSARRTIGSQWCRPVARRAPAREQPRGVIGAETLRCPADVAETPMAVEIVGARLQARML